MAYLPSAEVVVGFIISGFHYDTKSPMHHTLSLEVVPAVSQKESAMTGISPINFNIDAKTVLYMVKFSDRSNPADAIAALPTILLTIVLHSVTFAEARTAYSKVELTQVPKIQDISSATNEMFSTNPDFITGFSSIELGRTQPVVYSMTLTVDYIVQSSKSASVSSSTPTYFVSGGAPLFLYDQKSATCENRPSPTSGTTLTLSLESCSQDGKCWFTSTNPTGLYLTLPNMKDIKGVLSQTGAFATKYGLKATILVEDQNTITQVRVLDREQNVLTQLKIESITDKQEFLLYFDVTDSTLNFIIEFSGFNNLDSGVDGGATLHDVIIQQYTGRILDVSTNTCIDFGKCKSLVISSGTAICGACTGDKELDVEKSICQCSPGMFFNTIKQVCEFCTGSNCKTCSEQKPNICTSCLEDRKLEDGSCICGPGTYSLGTVCFSCPHYCQNCLSSSFCLNCITITQVNGVVRSTFRVRQPSGGCICDDSHYAVEGTVICKPCDVRCKTCDQNGQCTKCKDTATRTPLCQCPPGKYYPPDSIDGRCVSCDISCATCSDIITHCIACYDSTRVKNADGTCPCAIDYTEFSPRLGSCRLLVDCGQAGCSKCQQGLCTVCNRELNFNPTPMSDGRCICASGYWRNPLNPEKCIQCPDGCKTCDGTVCTSCFDGIRQPIDGKCNCPEGYYPDLQSLACKSCETAGCKNCSATDCYSCISPFALVAGVCVCQNGMYRSGAVCKDCPVKCKLCSNDGCLECVAGSYLQPNMECASTCPEKYYGDGSVCRKCGQDCAECIAASKCLVCSTGLLYEGSCFDKCPKGTFSSGGNCLQCDKNCQDCEKSAQNCLKCANQSMVLYNNECVASCPSNTMNVGGACQSCNKDCIICISSAPDYCVKCQNNMYSNRGKCVAVCPQDLVPIVERMICASECLPAQFFDKIQRLCVACSPSCRSCKDKVTCTSCGSNLNLYKGVCTGQCPADTAAVQTNNGGECVSCLPECRSCSTPTTCISCFPGGNLYRGKCLTCLGSTIFIEGQCVTCPLNCASCTGTTNQNIVCTSCLGGALPTSSGGCTRCLPPCAKCGSQPQICTECSKDYVLVENSCQRYCPNPDLFPSNNVCRCRNNMAYYKGQCLLKCPLLMGLTKKGGCAPCSIHCQSCEQNEKICTVCDFGYTLEAGSCISTNQCAFGQAKVDGVCSSICQAGKLLTQDGFCNIECPVGFIANVQGTGCISKAIGPVAPCSFGQFYAFNSCHAFCPPTTFRPKSGFTCQPCSENCFQCTDIEKCHHCIPGFYLSNQGKCLPSVVCSRPQVSLGVICVSECPIGTFDLDGYCTWICPPGTAYYDKWCYPRCPEGMVRSGLVCVRSCPPNTRVVDGICTAAGASTLPNTYNQIYGAITTIVDGCPPGSYTTNVNGECESCNPPCTTCIGTATFCTSCMVGIPKDGTCESANPKITGRVLEATITNALKIGIQVQLQISLTKVPPLLPSAIQNFYRVTLPEGVRAQIYQFKDLISPKINVFLSFDSQPPPNSIIILNLNVDSVGSAYEELGFTDLKAANVQMVLRDAKMPI